MPRMDGLTLAREIKARADLPIIVLSAIDAGDSKADLLEEVAEDYVTKPYHYPELRARINRVLRRLGDKVPRQSLVLGPNLTLDLHRRQATVGGEAGPADPDRVAPAVRPGREPRPDGDDRDAPGPRLGRDRGCRPVLRLGHDAAAPPEGRARPEPARSTSRPSAASATGSSRSTAPCRWLTTRQPVAPDAAGEDRSAAGDDERSADGRRSPGTSVDRAATATTKAIGPVVAHLPFRTRLTLGLIAAAILPLAGSGSSSCSSADTAARRGRTRSAGCSCSRSSSPPCSGSCSPTCSRPT